jgi:hypothetical protein
MQAVFFMFSISLFIIGSQYSKSYPLGKLWMLIDNQDDDGSIYSLSAEIIVLKMLVSNEIENLESFALEILEYLCFICLSKKSKI